MRNVTVNHAPICKSALSTPTPAAADRRLIGSDIIFPVKQISILKLSQEFWLGHFPWQSNKPQTSPVIKENSAVNNNSEHAYKLQPFIMRVRGKFQNILFTQTKTHK